MILPDVNLLLHAYNSSSPRHFVARLWWEACLEGDRKIRLPWVVALGFLRLSTHHRIAANPLAVDVACEIVASWLVRPQVSVLHPGARHAEILFELLRAAGTGGNLTTDAHLAALAIEHQVELQSTDGDFSRFPGLHWRNPLNTE
ncbi:MAG TPA: TA system VapC family ribonuclease toxin [Thermoanaerobaculia bacterium]|nr:TA system VapC family ribonuclease toxin [Thermoanaerobaculia bacterium]